MLELAKDFPTIMVPLITERDQWMVAVLRDLARDAPVVVAVVGAGHLSGIREHWEREIDIEEIQRMPPKRRSWRPYLLAAAGLTATTVLVLRWRRRAS
jgi:pheromone shutdown protein TraB